MFNLELLYYMSLFQQTWAKVHHLAHQAHRAESESCTSCSMETRSPHRYRSSSPFALPRTFNHAGNKLYAYELPARFAYNK